MFIFFKKLFLKFSISALDAIFEWLIRQALTLLRGNAKKSSEALPPTKNAVAISHSISPHPLRVETFFSHHPFSLLHFLDYQNLWPPSSLENDCRPSKWPINRNSQRHATAEIALASEQVLFHRLREIFLNSVGRHHVSVDFCKIEMEYEKGYNFLTWKIHDFWEATTFCFSRITDAPFSNRISRNLFRTQTCHSRIWGNWNPLAKRTAILIAFGYLLAVKEIYMCCFVTYSNVQGNALKQVTCKTNWLSQNHFLDLRVRMCNF